jgi:L-arabinose isomerase
VLETVAARAAEMAAELSRALPFPLVCKVTAKTAKEISDVVKEANYDDACAGVVTWCHTFSPSKMWINGLDALQKPWCHFATQYNREIPNEEIDMDFMNLNQAAHGDREHGFIGARLRKPRKVIAGYWKDAPVQKRLGDWMRAAVGAAVSRSCALATICGRWPSPRATRWRRPPSTCWPGGRGTAGRSGLSFP